MTFTEQVFIFNCLKWKLMLKSFTKIFNKVDIPKFYLYVRKMFNKLLFKKKISSPITDNIRQ